MKRKLKSVLAVILVAMLTACSVKKPERVSETGTITINFTIIDATKSEEVLFDGAVEVPGNCETLADVINNAPQLNAITENTAYGMTIISLMGRASNWDKGPWWMYESSDNDSCVEAGYCDGASKLLVEDDDSFIFKLSDEY